MSEEVLLVLSTWPDGEGARAAAHALVVEQLVACANMVPGVESVYRWQSNVESSTEVLILMKTTRRQYPALELRIKELHPYEVPEILSFAAAGGLPTYLAWVKDSCTRTG